MDYAAESLKLHYEWKGKLEVTPRAAVDSKEALSLAYTPGVAQPCLEIQKDVNKSYDLTRRWNTVAVVTDGTAVLGAEPPDHQPGHGRRDSGTFTGYSHGRLSFWKLRAGDHSGCHSGSGPDRIFI